jgi:hypothetical protein
LFYEKMKISACSKAIARNQGTFSGRNDANRSSKKLGLTGSRAGVGCYTESEKEDAGDFRSAREKASKDAGGA